jgi:hypothetical protein
VTAAVTLFGNERVNDDWRAGGRVHAGYWFDACQRTGIEASFFALDDATTRFVAGSSGDPVLARPFFNAALGQLDAELVAFPGVLAGRIAVTDRTALLGTGAVLRQNLCCGDCYRVDGLLGYRYLHLTDRLGVTEDLTSTDPTDAAVPLGTRFLVADRFGATNDFHGCDLGLAGEFRKGPWVVQWAAKVALGVTDSDLDVFGATTLAVPGSPATTGTGGLLALPSNSGHFTRDHFAVVPELGVKLGYQVTPHLRAYVGYDFLYWTQVVRPGGQIDLAVNPNLLPPLTPPIAGPARPEPRMNGTDVWAQGIGVGLEVRY